MPWKDIIWTEGDGGNIDHIADNGLSIGDVEYVVTNPEKRGTSRSSGRPMVFGHTETGEYICVIYEEIDEDTIYPVTAYLLED
jgi:uncharacterized DUF497 family protein